MLSLQRLGERLNPRLLLVATIVADLLLVGCEFARRLLDDIRLLANLVVDGAQPIDEIAATTEFILNGLQTVSGCLQTVVC